MEGSPRASVVAPAEAWRLAENFAAALPDAEILIGRGDSMLPLYPDRTVLVVQRMAMESLRAGMTVVFIGDLGRPVAHVLVRKGREGWIAQGVNNRQTDRTTVRSRNYIGTVVRAYAPDASLANTRPALTAPAGDRLAVAMRNPAHGRRNSEFLAPFAPETQ